MSDSWQTFVRALSEESLALATVGASALALTEALVANDPGAIEAAERKLDFDRQQHLAARSRRTGMQQRGFGDRSLDTVARYAPPAVRRQLLAAMADLRTHAISLRITNRNNRALVASGMERIRKTVSALQQAAAERTGTYKRRGIVPPADASVLVSQRA